jgi:DNA-binding NarL/FixJ family response regulator
VTEATSFAEASAALACQPFDICLVDPGVGDSTPLEGIRSLRQSAPATPVVVVTERESRHFALQAIEVGAQGFILKRATADEMRRAVERVLEGEIALPSNLSEMTEDRDQSHGGNGMSEAGASFASARRDNPVAGLTPRQRDVLGHIATGKRNAEIGRLLDISPRTVQIHVSTILKLLGVGNRTEAALLARKHGLGA